MQNQKIVRQTVTILEGLEQRQFFSAAPGFFAGSPGFGEFARPPAPFVFDGGLPSVRATPLTFADTQVVVAAEAANLPAVESGAFNGYPASASVAAGNSGSMMSLVNRAVDGEVVSAEEIRSAGFTGVQPSGTTPHFAVAAPSDAAATPADPSSMRMLPGGPVAKPLSIFSNQPIRSEAVAGSVSGIAASLAAAEQEIACVVRLAWADVLHSDGFASLDRLASEAGRSIVEHADAELAAALVLGVAGAAWWARQNDEDAVAEPTAAKYTWIEPIYPPA